MADRGKPLDVATIRRIQRLRETMSIRQTAKAAQVDRHTVRKYDKKSKKGRL